MLFSLGKCYEFCFQKFIRITSIKVPYKKDEGKMYPINVP